MKKIHVESVKSKQIKQFCVKYHPSSAGEARPSIDALWDALSTYANKANGIWIATRIGTAYRTLKEATLDAKARHPSIGLTILENGRDMFPTVDSVAIH